MTPRILIIAGSDSGGGAGIQADIKTVTMLGGHAMTAITAITAQNTLGVQRVFPLPSDLVADQFFSVVNDIGVDAIKIGMLGRPELVEMVWDLLIGLPNGLPIVFDPVMVATSGDALNEQGTAAAMHRLLDLATIATPNLSELDALGGETVILEHGCALLVKGGHGDSDLITDRLVELDGTETRWESHRIDTTSTHGTGCTLASAIATNLAYGKPLKAAVARARQFVRLALHDAPGLGGGHGPMGHQSVRLDLGPGVRLNQVTVPTDDYAASCAFYAALGFRQIVGTDDAHYARFEAAGGATLSVESGARPTVYVECENLDAEVARLEKAGVTFDQLPTDQSWLWREARLTDPSGNAVCLYQAGENRRYPPWRLD
ncbi:bifunctional hydroxymethylpyrimidine kinase/phosphomethylpyrimidine kinase [Sphingomonas panacisoli]|uniref:hydroxymethylpyrimidine kinase n=1 Tax=Sphingomonas panacisoli TaxID=1813879 RepID=A0A5B8LNQ2_9SPHN|nr:bifunctional hydroxymethylpyrimidine kinase/phosphomethylpyrimidine kinase [Sphingomonas panacisoli]QDZ08710.1 bifunctional hydroxymethylpyrimidine kinase/phosphomethylpyrimidine kinase [Sphingomonas panacisoli]